MALCQPVRCVIYSFLEFENLINKISRISKSERSLATKYSEILDVKNTFEVFKSFPMDLEQVIALSKYVHFDNGISCTNNEYVSRAVETTLKMKKSIMITYSEYLLPS
jgi:hypothetical protein